MTPMSQVWHVLRKDVRRVWGMLAMYVVAVVLAAVGGIPAAARWEDVSTPATLAVFVLNALIIASVVQDDSPSVENAFWRSRPFSPGAVLGAKLGSLLVLIALPAAVLLIVLPLAGMHSAALLGRAMGVVLLEAVATGCVYLALAALTRDLRAFVLASLALLVCGSIFASRIGLNTYQVQSFTHAWSLGFSIFGVLSYGALAVWLYQRVARVSIRWIVFLGVLVVNSFAGNIVDVTTGRNRGTGRPDGSLGRAQVAVTLADASARVSSGSSAYARTNSQLSISIAARASSFDSTMLLALHPAEIVLYIRDRRVVRVHTPTPLVPVYIPNPDLGADMTWRGAGPHESNFGVDLSSAEEAAFAVGVDSIGVNGTLVSYAPRQSWSLPLTSGASAVLPDGQVSIGRVSAAGGDVSVELSGSSVRSPLSPNDPPFGMEIPTDVLVNKRLHEVWVLQRRIGGVGSHWYVLPGFSLQSRASTVVPQRLGEAPPAPDSSWLDGARVVSFDWIINGTREVHLRGRVSVGRRTL
jgi:hypothetical protein